MTQFHETIYGRRFFDSQLPQLIKQLENIGEELKRMNDMKGVNNVYPLNNTEGTNNVRTLEDELIRLSDDIVRYDYRIAQVIDELLKND